MYRVVEVKLMRNLTFIKFYDKVEKEFGKAILTAVLKLHLLGRCFALLSK